MEKQIGNYSFIIGVIVAVVLGLAAPKLGTATAWLWSLLVILGLVVGFLNVSGKETKEFLLVAVSIVIVAYAGGDQIKSWAIAEPVLIPVARLERFEIGPDTLSVITPVSSKTLFALSIVCLNPLRIKNT